MIKLLRELVATSRQLNIECYPDADFPGIWGYENVQDPNCARICIGCIMTIADFTVLWMSKLQMETALLTIEAEYIALRMSMKQNFHIILLVRGVTNYIGVSAE